MATKNHDLFGPGSNFEGRVLRDYQTLADRIDASRRLGLKIVLTSGTFDLFHVGHSRYLERAKEHGDLLVVGVDSDDKVRSKKGPHRPVVAEDERMEILCHSRHVDLVFLKQREDEHWQLIRTVRPDVLIVTQDTYGGEDLSALREYCSDVVVLEPQATTSTTARIRSMLVGPAEQVRERLRSAMEDVFSVLDQLTGGGS